jgi:hypothetical protein
MLLQVSLENSLPCIFNSVCLDEILHNNLLYCFACRTFLLQFWFGF